MNIYKTLNGGFYNINELPVESKSIYTEIKASYDAGIEWTRFTNLWTQRISETFSNEPKSVIVESPIYKICQDLDSRIGIKQGYTREPDYRDILADLISMHYKSRYQFCKKTGIGEGYLSSVLNRKKEFSITKLREILEIMNYRIAFIEKQEADVREKWHPSNIPAKR